MPGDVVPGSGAAPERPLPPVSSAGPPAGQAGADASRPLPPFFPGAPRPAAPAELAAASEAEFEAAEAVEVEEPPSGEPVDVAELEEAAEWEPTSEGHLEAAFAAAERGAEVFPEDAFFLPEEQAGADDEDEEEAGPIEALARRLERLAARLRTDGPESLVELPMDDALDALLGGVLAGYLTGRHG